MYLAGTGVRVHRLVARNSILCHLRRRDRWETENTIARSIRSGWIGLLKILCSKFISYTRCWLCCRGSRFEIECEGRNTRSMRRRPFEEFTAAYRTHSRSSDAAENANNKCFAAAFFWYDSRIGWKRENRSCHSK